MRKQRRGFTLFETILVLAVLAVAAALAAPTLQSLAGATPLNAAADAIKARMAEARARAMAEGRPYRFDVQENTGKMRVAPDSSEFWDDGSGDNATTSSDNGPPPLIVEDILPKEIRFCSPDGPAPSAPPSGGQTQPQGAASGAWMCPVVFLPDGTTRQDAEIAFGGGGNRPLVLRVQSATGAITTSR